VNDVTRQVPLGHWLDQQAELAAHLTRSRGVRRIYVSGVPPMGLFPVLPHPLRGVIGSRAARFDRALAAACAADPVRRHLAFNPSALRPGMLAEDGFHPSPALYKVWAGELAAAIRRDFAAPSPTGEPA
jgi:lysophospholipase L1-like esterase